ncbi:M23 family metallopeptidase [Arcobacter sp. F2176]|uniref:M23 family metallopeptidase n=1 Tax=Arcobacter sp. F2176 TaxID=2044511 RepID=UPI00100B391D|nr:M23 family metallopeptidase [Arcobacter sp. F2176]RXJ82012.1 peptidase M23 [Arcobacter sp. F2176]
MNIFKNTLLLTLFTTLAFSNSTNIYQYQNNINNAKKLYLDKNTPLQIKYEKNIANGQTLLIQIIHEKITDPKLTLGNINLPFYKDTFKKDSFYALIPISYYHKSGNDKVIISYIKDNRRLFTSIKINIYKGNYKSEEIKVANSKINLNNKDKIRANKEYKQAMDIYNTTTKEILWKKDFIMPMYSKITSDFGTKRVYNKQLKSYHSGVDFRADIGTPIVAANDGIVRFAGNRFYSGNSIIIDHGQGIFTCYFHLSKILVKKDQKIKRDDKIGLSGETGRITGPHLHFGTRIHGVLVDPQELFKLLNKLNERY